MIIGMRCTVAMRFTTTGNRSKAAMASRCKTENGRAPEKNGWPAKSSRIIAALSQALKRRSRLGCQVS